MIRFSCRSCQRALYIHEVGFWAGGHSFCNHDCLAQVDTAALTSSQPGLSVRADDLTCLIASLGEQAAALGAFCKSLARDRGIPLGGAATTAAFATGVGAGVVLLGLAVSSVQDSQEQRARDSLQDGLLNFEEQLSLMVRHFMAFHENGHALPQTLSATLQTCRGFDARHPADTYGYLLTVYDQLKLLDRHVRDLRPALP